jgi:transcription elongation factor Elf1
MNSSKSLNWMFAKKIDRKGVLERNYIHCPICGQENTIAVEGKLQKLWRCIYCNHLFLFKHLGNPNLHLDEDKGLERDEKKKN